MTTEKHGFALGSVWTENSDGDGILHFDWGGALPYGVPASTGGKPGRSNPEEMLVAAAVSCYSITLALLMEKKRFPACRIETRAEGEMIRQPDRTLKFTAIRMIPRIFVTDSETDTAALLDLAHKAERYCLVSNALRGNVEISVAPEIMTE